MIAPDNPADQTEPAARKITREQGKEEQRQHALCLTVAERLSRMDDLNRQMLALRGRSLDQLAQDNTVCRVRRSSR